MSDLTETGRNKSFAEYAEKHEIFDLFQKTLAKLIIAKPSDPYQFLIDAFSRKDTFSVLILAPSAAKIAPIVDLVTAKLGVIHIDAASLLKAEINLSKSSAPDTNLSSLVIQELKRPEVIQRGYVLSGFPRNHKEAVTLLREGFIPGHIVDIGTKDGTSDHEEYEFVDSEVKDSFSTNHRKFEMHSEEVPEDLLDFLGTMSISRAPRSFRIIVSGLPGSGKTTIAEKIADKYGAVVVSPKSVILRAISSGKGDQFLPFLGNLHRIPSDILGEAIANRLKEDDCVNRGWVLDDYPVTDYDTQVLKDFAITPNRVVWLDASHSTCWDRLAYRRHDPHSINTVNLKNVPPSSTPEDYNGWITAAKDKDENLKERFARYEATKATLKSNYGVRTLTNNHGIFQCVKSDGVGEGNYNSSESVFETVQSFLSRPVPLEL